MASSAGARCAILQAASSSASGMPSRRRQMRATGRAVDESSRNPGSALRARSRKSWTDSRWARRAGSAARSQIWQLEGRNPPDHLAWQAKRLAAGGEHGHARTVLKQRHDEGCARPEQVLAVIEQHHHRTVSELLHQSRRGGPGVSQRQAQRSRGGRRHQPPVPDPGQLDQPRAIRGRVGVREQARGLDPQPRLADTARSAQRQEPGTFGQRQQL